MPSHQGGESGLLKYKGFKSNRGFKKSKNGCKRTKRDLARSKKSVATGALRGECALANCRGLVAATGGQWLPATLTHTGGTSRHQAGHS